MLFEIHLEGQECAKILKYSLRIVSVHTLEMWIDWIKKGHMDHCKIIYHRSVSSSTIIKGENELPIVSWAHMP